jgi:hypothetical protein
VNGVHALVAPESVEPTHSAGQAEQQHHDPRPDHPEAERVVAERSWRLPTRQRFSTPDL